MTWQEKIGKFMHGRYGMDNLNNFLFWLYIILWVIDIFVNNQFLSISEIFIIFVLFFRTLSKNIYKRNKENQIYLNFKEMLMRPFKNILRNCKDKEHVYKKCRKCHTTLKLPLPTKMGFQYAKCPKCKNRVRLFVLRKQKIEIIKKL